MPEFWKNIFGGAQPVKTTAMPQVASETLNSYTIRLGEHVPTDQAFNAWTSGDLKKMLEAINAKTNKIDRHFLLMGIVDATYKERFNPEMAQLCCDIAELHLNEFPSMVEPLKKDMGSTLPHVTTFQRYATILTEHGEFEKAVQVCERAIGYGLHDGTKSDFSGRIDRIKKLQSCI